MFRLLEQHSYIRILARHRRVCQRKSPSQSEAAAGEGGLVRGEGIVSNNARGEGRRLQATRVRLKLGISPETVAGLTHYEYERMDPALLPSIYVAYHASLGEPTEVFHNDIRGRYNRGDPEIVQAMVDFAQKAEDGRQAILERDAGRLSQLIDENFDLRNSISTLAPWQIQMVQVARSCGASAKFAGSGGAIIGVYRDEAMLHALVSRLEAIGSRVIKPRILP